MIAAMMRTPLLPLLACLVTATLHADDAVIERIVAHASSHPQGDTAFAFDQSAYRGDLSQLPIGVFDSGIGGLTVLQAILQLDAFHNDNLQPGSDGVPDFVNERFIYFGDQANMPYGNYSAAGKTDFLRELILKDTVFMLGKRRSAADAATPVFDKPPVKAIVIACNTATAYGLDDVRAALKAWGLPVVVVGVVEAGARGVQELHRDSNGAVAVLATVGTCASNAYPRLITSTLGLAGQSIPNIQQQGSPSLAGVIEGDPAFPESIAQCAAREVRALMETHRVSSQRHPIATIVLGCTHFPLARAEIDAAFADLCNNPLYHGLIAPQRTYVDPAEWTARELFRTLAATRMRLKTGERCIAAADAFFISVPNKQCTEVRISPDGGLDRDYKYGRNPGNLEREDTINVPMRPQMLPPVSANLVREKLPLVWHRLSAP